MFESAAFFSESLGFIMFYSNINDAVYEITDYYLTQSDTQKFKFKLQTQLKFLFILF